MGYYRIRRARVLFILSAIVIGLAFNVFAEIPPEITYQGYLTNSMGVPLDGFYNLKFKIYSGLTGNDSLWSSGWQTVSIAAGSFTYRLGSNVGFPAGLFTGDNPRYLGITVEPDPEGSPRIKFTSEAYSHHAYFADTAAYALNNPGGWVDDGSVVHLANNGDRVGIGTATPSEMLSVGDDLTSVTGNLITVGDADPYEYAGISYGQNADNRGWTIYSNAGDYIYWGTRENGTLSPNSMYFKGGNVGIGSLPGAYRALFVYKTFTPPVIDEMCYGIHTNISSSNAFGYMYGGKFTADGGDLNVGVHATARNSNFSIGGMFNADDIGIQSNAPIAGYFEGSVTITGNLSKASGSFKIDHPLDPANKYLFHSFVESPDMMNVYNGNVTLDDRGRATVKLPDYFEALNKDFRYQLTAIGGPGPNLYIAKEISDGLFEIAGGQPGLKVSWQVTGIRHDPWANKNRIQVEVDKEGQQRGKFIHPELYDLDDSYKIKYFETPESGESD